MDSLPIELLDIIASYDVSIYRGLLVSKEFAYTLNYSKRLDYFILFGGSIIITKYKIEWRLNCKAHRTDGPAVEFIAGPKFWYFHGMKHRVGGPACEESSGTEEWYQYGRLHCTNGPAVISKGTEEWYFNGLLHRDNGPAVKLRDGTKKWYYMGKPTWTIDSF